MCHFSGFFFGFRFSANVLDLSVESTTNNHNNNADMHCYLFSCASLLLSLSLSHLSPSNVNIDFIDYWHQIFTRYLWHRSNDEVLEFYCYWLTLIPFNLNTKHINCHIKTAFVCVMHTGREMKWCECQNIKMICVRWWAGFSSQQQAFFFLILIQFDWMRMSVCIRAQVSL